MNTQLPWLLYGANGYTGRRIAEEAVRRGRPPVVAGRDPAKTADVAASLGCESRVFALDDPAAVRRQLAGVAAVLHCAGPFSATAEPMIEACLASGVHYLDITGEIDVIEHSASQDARARAAGVALLPAVGFDVVPSDCLAAMLHRRLPDAIKLELAFAGTGTISRGTARTMLENLPQGGRVRIDGRITKVPLAWKSKEISFRAGLRTAVTIPWGDVASAWHSTGVPNIEVYLAMDRRHIAWLRRLRPAASLLRLPWPEPLVERVLRRFVLGGDNPSQHAERGSFWGRMENAEGRSVEATLETLDGYSLTVETALACLDRVLAGDVAPGFATPSKAFGPDFIFAMPQTNVEWP
ncbi:MAG TPA: hypothetical protein DD670_05465 [Planctomycetaceae bacterium]|nr:hypothetical protein [Planctomycetaceae bacterium]